MRHSVRLPAAAFAVASFLSHTLDWLNPWHHDTADIHAMDGNFQTTHDDHIYPEL